MTIEWDETKRRANLRKHGLDFADAAQTFAGPMLLHLDTRQDYGEDRWQGIGMLHGRVVVAVFAERGPDTIRLISFRKADRDETKEFEIEIQN